jgi:hypothetical protein
MALCEKDGGSFKVGCKMGVGSPWSDGGWFSMVGWGLVLHGHVYGFEVHSGTDYEISSVEVKLETKKAVAESVGVSGGVPLT